MWRVSKMLKRSQFLKWQPMSLTLTFQPKLDQNEPVGSVSESLWWADSKSVIGSPIKPSIHGENMEIVCCILNAAKCILMKFHGSLLGIKCVKSETKKKPKSEISAFNYQIPMCRLYFCSEIKFNYYSIQFTVSSSYDFN